MASKLVNCPSKLIVNWLIVSSLLFTQLMMVVKSEEEEDCPKQCTCHPTNELECSHLEMTRIPPSWPTHYQKIVLKNCSINTIEKNAFRRFQHLREVHLENCSELDVIDKFAFKGLQKLRLISIVHNPKLKELYKASFSGIGNQHSMRIHIKHNAIERVRAHTFKNANNLRELIVEDKCFEVESLAFASIFKVDFLTVKGACLIEEKAFQNTSRVHSLSILDSSLDIKPKTFAELNHVNQVSVFAFFNNPIIIIIYLWVVVAAFWSGPFFFYNLFAKLTLNVRKFRSITNCLNNKSLVEKIIQLRDNRIGQIEVEAFAGLFTVGTAHLQSNQIGRILPRAFANAENLGSLVLSYNTVREPLTSRDCMLNGAQKFVFTENTLHCSCEMRWIQFYEDQALLAENYCGREEAFKALTYYKPLGCPPLQTHIQEEHYQTPPTTSSSSRVPPASSQPPLDFSQNSGKNPNLVLSQQYLNEMNEARGQQLPSPLFLLSVSIVYRMQRQLFGIYNFTF